MLRSLKSLLNQIVMEYWLAHAYNCSNSRGCSIATPWCLQSRLPYCLAVLVFVSWSPQPSCSSTSQIQMTHDTVRYSLHVLAYYINVTCCFTIHRPAVTTVPTPGNPQKFSCLPHRQPGRRRAPLTGGGAGHGFRSHTPTSTNLTSTPTAAIYLPLHSVTDR
jgi:hypothetical protein